MADELDRELLRAVLDHVLQNKAFPAVAGFQRRHAADVARFEELVSRGLLKIIGGRYYPTLPGLHECASKEAEEQIGECQRLFPDLQEAWRHERGTFASAGDLYPRLTVLVTRDGSVFDVGITIGFFLASGLISATVSDSTGLPAGHLDLENLLYVDDFAALLTSTSAPAPVLDLTGIALRGIEISGYRPFVDLSADLGDLTVIIGANAAGKSSLFDFLRFVVFASQAPLPPEIDPRCAGKMLFHAGAAERLTFALSTALRAPQALRYEAEIHGPVGSPRVMRERLVLDRHGEKAESLTLLDMRGGRGAVRDLDPRQQQAAWTVPPNELALRRAIAPNLPTLSRFQSYLSSWRFYGGFDVGPSAAIRRPAQVEESPVLAEDGDNLSAVLHALALEHREAWEELESHLGATVPGFLSLAVKPRAKGMTIAVMRERGVTEELTVAELSDGTLRLLCWLALAVWPSAAPLMCLDEPEIGLHPRVLPTLAGALQLASARSQILVATHSPHLLSQFSLEDIAVMRKEDGRAVFVRPSTSEALRLEVAEIGGEALARLFLSEELEVLP